jgi:hypothetical protein
MGLSTDEYLYNLPTMWAIHLPNVGVGWERVVNVVEENFVKCSNLKKLSFGRNPTTFVFISLTSPSRI